MPLNTTESINKSGQSVQDRAEADRSAERSAEVRRVNPVGHPADVHVHKPRTEEQKKGDAILEAKVVEARLAVANLEKQKPWAADTTLIAADKARILKELLEEQVESKKDHSAPLHDAKPTIEEKRERERGSTDDLSMNKFETAYEPISEALKVTLEQLADAVNLLTALKLKLTSRPFPTSKPRTSPEVIVNQIQGIQKLSSRILEYYTQLLKLL